MQLVECVPNFSEGRDLEIVGQIKDAIASVPGAYVLDVQSDRDHNRSVITFVGRPEAVQEAAFRGVARAAELINLNQHEGEHPRMGAADVVPFVPVDGVTMEDCVVMARRVGERIGEELQIPVYFYAEAAMLPEREVLANIRRGEYEAIKEEIETDPDRAPDCGPKRLGPAGATAVGARFFLIAYNVNLGTSELGVAKAVARQVRESSGGLKHVQALGMNLAERGIVQVSMNLLDYRNTPPHQVTEMVRREASRYGVPVVGSEIIGLIPQAALDAAADFYLQVEDFSRRVVLENQYADAKGASPEDFLEELAAPTPTPGGGSAAALVGALASSLATMVSDIGFERYDQTDLEGAVARSKELRRDLTALMEADSESFQRVLAAYRSGEAEAIQDALQGAADVPLEMAARAVEVLELLTTVVERGPESAVSDAAIGAYLAETAVKAGTLLVRVNAADFQDEALKQEYLERGAALREGAQALADEVSGLANQRLMAG